MKKFLAIVSLLLAYTSLWAFDTPEAHYKMGVQYISQRQYIEAIKEFTEAISQKGTYADAYYQRAVAKKRYCDETGCINYDFCTDLILAVENGNVEASSMLVKECASECYTIEAALMEPEKVFCADFSRSKITSLPSQFEKLTKLTHLNISDNEFVVLDVKIASIKYLFMLDFSNNKVKALPDWIEKCTYLVEFAANDNAIENLNAKLAKLAKLQSLQLRNNFLADLPAEMVHLKSLTTLDVSYNEFTSVPNVLLEMKQLKVLDISGNEINDTDKQKLKEALPNTDIKF